VLQDAFPVLRFTTAQKSRHIVQDAPVVISIQGLGQALGSIFPAGVAGQGCHKNGERSPDGFLGLGLIGAHALAELGRGLPRELALQQIQE